MAAVDILPTESLLDIFEYLCKKDLFNVIKVCRRWREAGEPPYYKKLKVRFEHGGISYDSALLDIERNSRHVKAVSLLTHDPVDPLSESIVVEIMQNFSSVKSFSYGGIYAIDSSPCGIFWNILSRTIVSMRDLVSLEIHHSLFDHVLEPYTSYYIPTLPSGSRQRLPHLKEIVIDLDIDDISIRKIDPFFKRLLATIDGAEDLVSTVNFRLLQYRQRQIDATYTWQLRNLRKLSISDPGEFLPADLISADFSKIRVLTLGPRSIRRLCNYLTETQDEESSLRPQSFSNVEVLYLKPRLDDGYWDQLDTDGYLADAIRCFPSIKEFWAEYLGILVFPITRDGDGQPVIGPSYKPTLSAIAAMAQR